MISKLSMKTVSSLEACFLDETVSDKQERNRFLMYRNEKLSFQVICSNDQSEGTAVPYCRVSVEGTLAPYVTVREMVCVPAHYPVCPQNYDDNYLRTTPGLYPNLLRPLRYRGHEGIREGCLRLPQGQLRALWIDVSIPEEASVPRETTELTFVLHEISKNDPPCEVGRATASIRVSALKLPKQKLIHTEWFYCDCIAEAYHTKAFSERHWKMIEKYLATAVDNGINMIMTPVFTQELDTYIGGERMTTQLVGITVEDDGSYRFDFTLLDRWIDLCERLGVEYYEIPHFFTQWGAKHAPKFVAKVKGRTKKIFGWETDSMGPEYGTFLATFIPALVAHFKKRGIDHRCYYHISDEPHLSDLEQYLACKERVAPYLEGYNIIDALSDYSFYEKGVLAKPVPGIKRCHAFLEHEIPGLWVYYCGANGKSIVTDRYLSMPLARTRILGVQLYRHKIEGFLHWGYNFYHNQNSYEFVDPLNRTDGEYFAPDGDMYLVYPGTDGEVWESLRLNAMREAMDDIRALELCEAALGREAAEKLIHEGVEEPLTFFAYPKESEYLLSLHDRVLLAVENKTNA